MNRSVGRDGSGAGRGRGVAKSQSRKYFLPSQNGIGKKTSDDIRILYTPTLIREVQAQGICSFGHYEFVGFLASIYDHFLLFCLVGESLWFKSSRSS